MIHSFLKSLQSVCPPAGLLRARHHLRGKGHQDKGDVGRERAVADQVHGALPGTQFNRKSLGLSFGSKNSFSAGIPSLYVLLSLKGPFPPQKSLFVPYRTQRCPFAMNFKEIWVSRPQKPCHTTF